MKLLLIAIILCDEIPPSISVEAERLFEPSLWQVPNVGRVFTFSGFNMDSLHTDSEADIICNVYIDKTVVRTGSELKSLIGRHVFMPAEKPALYKFNAQHHSIVHSVEITAKK